ncbi:MAG: hypothetical protein PF447_07970 [Spirochaetaceae bacterium]|jgi:hypothetical protein|nr:hypothetical protein [Spirochaetaceae bacterium]
MIHLNLSEAEWASLEDLSIFPQLGIKLWMDDQFQWIDSDLIEEAWFNSGEDSGLSITSDGEILLTGDEEELNSLKAYLSPDSEIQVFFRLSDEYPWHHRFSLFVDGKGAQLEKEYCSYLRIKLYDLSGLMAASQERGDWENQAVYLDSVVCDKSLPEKSLVHIIANRWNISEDQIDCSLINWPIPYAHLKRNDWEELSDLARSYGVHLECGAEKRIVFAYSSFQEQPWEEEELLFQFKASHIYQHKETQAEDRFHNDIRLKWNEVQKREYQEIWRYADAPVNYLEDLSPSYPFLPTGNLRAIQDMDGEYQGLYSVTDSGQELDVVHAIEVDELSMVESSMEYSGDIRILDYDKDTQPDRCFIHVECLVPGELKKLAVSGIPYVMELNQCCYRRDQVSIDTYGRRVFNVTGPYFTQHIKEGISQCEKWVEETLTREGQPRKRYEIKTELPLFPFKAHGQVEIEGKLREDGLSSKAVIEKIYLFWKRGGLMKNRIVLLEEDIER